MDLPNPFFDEEEDNEGMEPASVAYRYRKFDLGNGVVVVCGRNCMDLVKEKEYMTAFALNEYMCVETLNWRDKMDTQFGAVLANELKNNSFQLAKWTAQSLLAGADQMKIGFVSQKCSQESLRTCDFQDAILSPQGLFATNQRDGRKHVGHDSHVCATLCETKGGQVCFHAGSQQGCSEALCGAAQYF